MVIKTTSDSRDRSVLLNVYLKEHSPKLEDLYWTKNGHKLDSPNEWKYCGGNVSRPSLTINNVNHHDAGSYQLNVMHTSGTATSELVVLGIYHACYWRPEEVG